MPVTFTNIRIKPDRQCTYNVALLQLRINKYCIFWMCVCSLRYPACTAHAPYFHMWLVLFCNIVPHYLTNGTIFEKTNIEPKMCFDFLLQLMFETFLILRRMKRHIIIKMKIQVYRTIIRPVVTCSSETWTLTAKDEKKLTHFWKPNTKEYIWSCQYW